VKETVPHFPDQSL